MASEKGVVLLDFWVSPFGQRARIALAEKGVQYQYKEEDFFPSSIQEDTLIKKSQLLLQSNPIYKKVPVLFVDGKPICESLVIVQYIDEVWSDKAPLLPSDPYQRAQARFWADYVGKVYECGTRIWQLKGEGQEDAKKEMIEILQILEAQLGDRKYFSGDAFGFVDVAFVPLTTWFYSYETFGNFSIEAAAPKIVGWAKRCMERESVAKSLYDSKKVHEFVCFYKKKLGIE